MYQQFSHAIIEPLTTRNSSLFTGSVNTMMQKMFPITHTMRKGGGIKVQNTKGRKTKQRVKSINNRRIRHITRNVYRKYKPHRKSKHNGLKK